MENLLTGVVVVGVSLICLLVFTCFILIDLLSRFEEIKKQIKDYKTSIDNKLTCIDSFNYNSKHNFQSFVDLSNDRFNNSIENLDYLQCQICDLQSQITNIKKSKKH